MATSQQLHDGLRRLDATLHLHPHRSPLRVSGCCGASSVISGNTLGPTLSLWTRWRDLWSGIYERHRPAGDAERKLSRVACLPAPMMPILMRPPPAGSLPRRVLSRRVIRKTKDAAIGAELFEQ